MEIVLDFNFNEDVVDLYHQSINYEFTSEFNQNPRQLNKEQVRNRLYEVSKSKTKNGFELHGILKVLVDGKLAAISFPRKILSKEYDMSANAIRARISKQSNFLIKSKIIDIKKYLPYPNQYLYNMKANREYWLMAINDYEQAKNNVNNMKQYNQI